MICTVMKKQVFISLFVLCCLSLNAQKNSKPALLYSIPISVTPLSFWDSDISVSAGAEFRFHPSFSARLAADYIYSDYGLERTTTSGVRLRHELRYYIAGNRLINSRSKAWPYISVSFGNKWVATNFSDWLYYSENNQSYQRWKSYYLHNREWYLMGRTGMQTVFGREKRFLFDFSVGVGLSNNNISYSFPDGDEMRSEVIENSYNDFAEISRNKYNGRFRALNMEICFGYRLLN